MKKIILLINFLTNLIIIQSKTNATYNSFIKQIGYCKLQGFLTESRSTSNSIAMFLDGRIKFGVGISDINMKSKDYNLCGMCINVTNVDNFYKWNNEITEWNKRINHDNFLAIVFDRCPDEICIKNFLDFDIYNPLQPVSHGNPINLEWYEIPCPIEKNEYIEYLICTSDTCNFQNKEIDSIENVIKNPTYFWSITFRNMRIPIKKVIIHYLNYDYELKKDNSWSWNNDLYDLKNGINMTFYDKNNKSYNDFIKFNKNENTAIGYNGGILIQSKIQN
jgi:hypothetical protein